MKASISIDIELPERPEFRFSGRYDSRIKIQLYGPFAGCGSLANVNTQIAHAILAQRQDIGLQSDNGNPYFDSQLNLYDAANRQAPVAIYWGTPETTPKHLFEHTFTIGGFICETDAIPTRWVGICNRYDLLVVPSHFCRDVYRAHGVTVPMMVVHHGLESEYRPYKIKQRSQPFVFYQPASPHFGRRKGIPELVRCYKRAFPDRSDVLLRIRTSQPELAIEAAQPFNGLDALPPIELLDAHTDSTAEFAAAYGDAHCTVHPTRGEGFGLIPFQSIACETPVIAPKHTGLSEYLNNDNAWLLKSQIPMIRDPGAADRFLRLIDEDHLIQLLQQAESQWEAKYESLRLLSKSFRKQYSWTQVLGQFCQVINQLVDSHDPVERKAIAQQADTPVQKKRALLVLAPESHGGHLATEILLNAGCEGSLGQSRNWHPKKKVLSEHDSKPWDSNSPVDQQPWDNKAPSYQPLIVWRRSLPHGGQWPDIQQMVQHLQASNYVVQAIVVKRELTAAIQSQIKWQHVKDESVARENIAKAIQHINQAIHQTGIQRLDINYEALIQGSSAQKAFLRSLDLESPEQAIKTWDGNHKWHSTGEAKHVG